MPKKKSKRKPGALCPKSEAAKVVDMVWVFYVVTVIKMCFLDWMLPEGWMNGNIFVETLLY